MTKKAIWLPLGLFAAAASPSPACSRPTRRLAAAATIGVRLGATSRARRHLWPVTSRSHRPAAFVGALDVDITTTTRLSRRHAHDFGADCNPAADAITVRFSPRPRRPYRCRGHDHFDGIGADGTSPRWPWSSAPAPTIGNDSRSLHADKRLDHRPGATPTPVPTPTPATPTPAQPRRRWVRPRLRQPVLAQPRRPRPLPPTGGDSTLERPPAAPGGDGHGRRDRRCLGSDAPPPRPGLTA